jgi:hypothetical protein
LESIGKNQTFHKHQAFDHSPNLGSKYTWHLLNSKYVPNLYYRTTVASKTKNCDLNFAGSDEVGYTI